MSNTLKDEIYGFVSGLPEWQKILATYLLQLTEQELKKDDVIQYSLEALLVENKLSTAPATTVKYAIPEKSDGSATGSASKFFLSSISNVQNLNALSSGQTLPVAETGLTVVYGENGVGKSGYGRLLNSAFYSRGDKTLIGNVYGPTKNQPHSATFEFIDGNKNKVLLKYPDQKTHPAFVQFSAFDSKSVNVHIDNQNELHVQPSELNFFEALIQLINLVSDKLDAIAKSKRPENQFSKAFPEDSAIKTQVIGISSKTNIEALTKLAALTDDETKRMADLDAKKASLSLPEMEKNKKRLSGIKTRIATLKTKMTAIETAFSTDKIELITKAITRYEELKAEVAKNGVEQFSDPRFKGIGSDLWQQFIKSAKELAALPGEPADPANACPYCRQDLTTEAIQLIERYAQFIDSKARDNMTKAHDWGKNHLASLEKIEIPEILEDEAFYLWAKEKYKDALNLILSNFNNTTPVKAGAIAAVKEWDKTKVINLNVATMDWVALENALDAEILELNEEKIKAETKKITDELLILNHRKILSGLIQNITTHVDGLKYADQIETLKKQISRTKSITDKATDLHERYISNRYVQLFKQECIDLNIPCPDLSPVGTKGKTKRKYSIVGEAPSKVLSEGEQRAVALADFFTEAQISEMCGLIFDDPVNSQDHKRKGNIAKRLAAESKNRQVIVFTHDLLFLNDVVMSAEECAVQLTCHWMSKNNNTETGIIYANTVPDTEKAFIDAKIAKERLAEAKNNANPRDAFRATKDGLGALRASYEAFIVRIVFDGIVERFSRRVRQTEIHGVHAPKEALFFISNKMGELSGYITGHLQVDASTTEINADLLEKEIGIYEKFSAEFKKEKKEALKSFKESKAQESALAH